MSDRQRADAREENATSGEGVDDGTTGQADGVVDGDTQPYLLRPDEEQAHRNERQLQTIIDSVSDVITVVSRSGVILSQSRAVSRVFGYEPEELVGRNIFDLIYEEDLDALHRAFFNVIEGFRESTTVRLYHPTRDSTYCLIEATVGKLRNASAPSVVFSFRPVASLLPGGAVAALASTLAIPARNLKSRSGLLFK